MSCPSMYIYSILSMHASKPFLLPSKMTLEVEHEGGMNDARRDPRKKGKSHWTTINFASYVTQGHRAAARWTPNAPWHFGVVST